MWGVVASCAAPVEETTRATTSDPHVAAGGDVVEAGVFGNESDVASPGDAGTASSPQLTSLSEDVALEHGGAVSAGAQDASAPGGPSLSPEEIHAAPMDAGSAVAEELPPSTPLPEGWRIDDLGLDFSQLCVLSGGIVFCTEGGSPTGVVRRSELYAKYFDEPSLPVRQIAGGDVHICARYDRAASCWGYDSFSQLGRGLLRTVVDVRLVAAGFLNTCMVTESGQIWCWGADGAGQLSAEYVEFGSISEEDSEPNRIDVNGSVHNVFVGGEHICALLEDGQLTCWGSNWFGEGGWQEFPSEGTPRIELGEGEVVGAAAGWHHTCAVFDDGSVKCWGQNNLGQLGLGDTVNRGLDAAEMGDLLPEVDLGAKAVQLALGSTHSCALLADGNIKCWGGYSEELHAQESGDALGDEPGEMGEALNTIALGVGRTASKIVAGGGRTCALRDDDSVYCWSFPSPDPAAE